MEPGFEQAEDGDAGVFVGVAAAERAAAADDGTDEARVEQAGEGADGLRREFREGLQEAGQVLGQGFAFFEGPEAGGAGPVVGLGGGLGGLDQGAETLVRSDVAVGGDGEEGCEAGLDAVDEVEEALLAGGSGAEAVDPRRWGGATEAGEFEGAGEGAAVARGEAEGGEGVLQDGKEGDGGEVGGDGLDQEAEEGAGRGFGEGLAGAVVDDDAEAGEFGGDAGGQRAVGGDERGLGAGGFEGLAEDEGDGDGLFLLVGGFEAFEAADVGGGLFEPGARGRWRGGGRARWCRGGR